MESILGMNMEDIKYQREYKIHGDTDEHGTNQDHVLTSTVSKRRNIMVLVIQLSSYVAEDVE